MGTRSSTYASESRRADRRRFWSKVDKSGGRKACWPWLAGRNRAGYGRFRLPTSIVFAHRWALEEKLKRPIHKGLHSLHKCDNPPCCNPTHLHEGTQAENNREMALRGRARGAVGESNAKTSLTNEDIVKIRALAASGVGQREIARRYQLQSSTAHYIIHRKTWKHV